MSKQLSFKEVKQVYFKRLEQYLPIVDRVHGGSHPEFHEVKSLFESINEQAKQAGLNKPDLTAEFNRLREVTNNYLVPGDVCESYESVYNMLEEIDKAYHD